MNHAILLISCADQKGITAAVARFVFENNGNIVHADQHIDEQNNIFFMRIEWTLDGFQVPVENIGEAFSPVARQFAMDWQIGFTGHRQKVAVFVSKPLHCLADLLYRYKSGQLPGDIDLIISNHGHAREMAGENGIAFFEFPVNRENKRVQEARQLELLKERGIGVIVLARYHQILTRDFIECYPRQVINIHHSFLPAFPGGQPYLRAFERGVKIIGATSHYVTEALDEGPIIEQDTVRISHRDALVDLRRKGEDLERMVLSRALRWHLERKVLCYGKKTVVFD